MPITSNVDGILHELDVITSNVGGVTHELDVVHSNVGGVLKEIHSSIKSKVIFIPCMTSSNYSDDTIVSYSFDGHTIQCNFSGKYLHDAGTENNGLVLMHFSNIKSGDVISFDCSHTRSNDGALYCTAFFHSKEILSAATLLDSYILSGRSGSKTVEVTALVDDLFIFMQCNSQTQVSWNFYINSMSINGKKFF